MAKKKPMTRPVQRNVRTGRTSEPDPEKERAHIEFHEGLYGRMAPDLRAELENLKKHESHIVAGLKDAATAKLLLTDPHAALRRMKVPLPPLMRTRLKDARFPPDLLEPKGFRLPTGQVIVPRVTIRIVGEKGETHARNRDP